MKDIIYPEYPENWEGGGGEGNKSNTIEGRYMHFFVSPKHNLEGTIDSPMNDSKHVIQIKIDDPEGFYNELVRNFKAEHETQYHYLKAKQKAHKELVKIMRKINEGKLLQDVTNKQEV